VASGQATLTISTLAVGVHSITAVYNGDVTFDTSASAAITQTVNKTASTTTLSSSINPALFGQPVTFTAALGGNGGIPTGTVTFSDGATMLAIASVMNGQATLTISTLSVGPHSITAVYNGDSSFGSSNSTTLNQTINKATPTIMLNSSMNPSAFTQAVTLTTTLTGSGGTPGGTVIFMDGSITLGTFLLNGGQAILTMTTLAVGQHSISVSYGGDSNFEASTSAPMVQKVIKSDTSIMLRSSANPAVNGNSITFTAVVSASPGSAIGAALLSRGTNAEKPTLHGPAKSGTIYPQPIIFPALGGSTPTGIVTFKDDTATLGTAFLDSLGQATFTLSTLPTGSHPITAVYGGDFNFNGSTSPVLTETVN